MGELKKTILVTGATDGIGKMTALRLAKLGHNIIIHGRSSAKVNATIDEFKKELGNKKSELSSSVFDLGSFSSVRLGAQDLINRFSGLDILINNAGTYQLERTLNKDGFELTMAINHLSPTLLTLLLKPLLLKSESSKSSHLINGPRVIFVSSIAHNRGQLLGGDFNYEKNFSAYGTYAGSKLANIMTTKKLALDWQAEGISVYALHPGVITTKLLKLGFNIEGDSLEKGSNTSVYLATAELDPKLNGQYFVESEPAKISSQAQNTVLADEFWLWTMQAIKANLNLSY